MGIAPEKIIRARDMGPARGGVFLTTQHPEGTFTGGGGIRLTPGRIRLMMFVGKVFPKAGVSKLPNANFSRDPKVEAMGRDPLIYAKPAAARTAAELIRAMARIRERAHELSLPVLLMHGSQDRLANLKGCKEFHANVSSGDKTLKIYEGLYHGLLHEPEAEQVFADWFGALQARSGRS